MENTNKSNCLLDNFLRTLVFTTIHEVTNSYSLIAGYVEDLVDELEENGSIEITSQQQLIYLLKGIKKLEASMDKLRANNYFETGKVEIHLHEFVDTLIESCRHAFNRGEPKITEECYKEKIVADRSMLFTICQLALIHFSTGDNHITISLTNSKNLKIISEKKFPINQLNMLYKSLDWRDSFRIGISEKMVSIDIL